ncbi:hypothetical protein Mgra_00001181 [Meloidogyne graminicola]|uniref:Uncharacterized protein n=1 Tax=Meloidogyne graminicola TaxID=189291 RepID=A0A8T0A1T9_9BILA|nr:hypothetical protein Mgra_00001181 [Meloidogyne graminicola]
MNYSFENYLLFNFFMALCSFNLIFRECWAKINRTYTRITSAKIRNNHDVFEQKRVVTNELALNPEKLDLLLYNIAIFCLLKSKARSLLLLPNFFDTERKLYLQCEDEAISTVQLAKCIVPLLKQREVSKSIVNAEIQDNVSRNARIGAVRDDRSLVSQFGSWLIRGLVNLGANEKTTIQKEILNDGGKKQFKNTLKTLRKRKNVNSFISPTQLFRHSKSKKKKRNSIGQLPLSLLNLNKKQVIKSNRWKRDVNLNDNPITQNALVNIKKLMRIQSFFERYNFCQKHLTRMGDANSRYIEELINHSDKPLKWPYFQFLVDHSKLESLNEELQRLISNYSFEALPILSPRMFSLFPNLNLGKHKLREDLSYTFLSPTLLSFHDEGMFSLPTLFGLASSNEAEVLEFLDLFMELTGASKVLDKMLMEIEPKEKVIERELYPALMKLEILEKRWKTVQNSLTAEQRGFLNQHGYALLNERQFVQLFNKKKKRKLHILDEDLFENIIRRMADMDVIRKKRHTPANNSAQEDGLTALRPFIYTNVMRQNAAVSLNNVILSPKAFVTTLLSPKFMTLNVLSPVAFNPNILSPKAMALMVLSPTAFTANILTPNTLWSEVLAPKFFHTNILSPRALSSLVLSPRTILGEVLSPKFLEFKALNPTTFYASVLTPNVMVPRVLSPSSFAVTVLSPNILSPSILSRGNFTIQILSPSIMSDDVTWVQLLQGKWEKENRNK